MLRRQGLFRALPAAFFAAAALCAFATAPRLAGQEPGSPPETQAPAVTGHKAHARAKAQAAANPVPEDQAQAPDQTQGQAQDQASPDVPPQVTAMPELPRWPVNETAGRPAVTLDSHGLTISAKNSSLQQILKDVSAVTGASVEGMTTDERVFGAYGPGQARDVLSQLLQGAGYNVIMIGDQGQGTPRQILLSLRHNPGEAAPADADNNNNANNGGDDDAPDNEVEEQPAPQQPPMRPGFPGGPPRTPQQMLQERQERLQQLRQMQQNQQNQNPSPNQQPQL